MGTLTKNVVIYIPGLEGNEHYIQNIKKQFLQDGYMFYTLPLSPYGSIIDDAKELRDLITRKKFYRPIIIGFSYGGMVALQYALSNSPKIGGLVLVNTSSYLGNDTLLSHFLYSVSFLVRFIPRNSFFGVLFEREYGREYVKKNIKKIIEIYGAENKDVILERLFSTQWFNVLDQLGSISCATLVLSGGEDRIIVPESSRALYGRIPNAELAHYEHFGHFMLSEHSDLLYYRMKKFITSTQKVPHNTVETIDKIDA